MARENHIRRYTICNPNKYYRDHHMNEKMAGQASCIRDVRNVHNILLENLKEWTHLKGKATDKIQSEVSPNPIPSGMALHLGGRAQGEQPFTVTYSTTRLWWHGQGISIHYREIHTSLTRRFHLHRIHPNRKTHILWNCEIFLLKNK
jgi:hypothetical protein